MSERNAQNITKIKGLSQRNGAYEYRLNPHTASPNIFN